eukprot:791760-Rhodomonas_salina.1
MISATAHSLLARACAARQERVLAKLGRGRLPVEAEHVNASEHEGRDQHQHDGRDEQVDCLVPAQRQKLMSAPGIALQTQFVV